MDKRLRNIKGEIMAGIAVNPEREYDISLRDHLEILYAVELLERHNKNWLFTSGDRLNSEKLGLLKRMLDRMPSSASNQST